MFFFAPKKTNKQRKKKTKKLFTGTIYVSRRADDYFPPAGLADIILGVKGRECLNTKYK
jgi:hypothetical protein